MSNIIQLAATTQPVQDINTITEGTYTRIDSVQVTETIETLLSNSGIEFTRRVQNRIGTKSTKHCVVYTLHSIEGLSINGDNIIPQIYVFNSYLKESAFMISVGFLRMVCDNGMVCGEDLFTTRIIHRTGPTIERRVAQITSGVSAALTFIQSGALQDTVRELTGLPLNTPEGISILASLPVPKRAREDAIAVWTGASYRRTADTNTVWGLWNIVNECMRLRANSIVANLEKNRNLLDHILTLAEYEVGGAA